MAEERKVLGERLTFEERISLAQLTTQPGWKVLVHLMAEACREATEKVIKLSPTTERYTEQLAGLQTTARAMNQFSALVLDSVKVHQRSAIKEGQERENPTATLPKVNRFRLPVEKSPEGAQ